MSSRQWVNHTFQEGEQRGWFYLQTQAWTLGIRDFWIGVSGPSYTCTCVLDA